MASPIRVRSSFVIVTFNSREAVEATLPLLVSQLKPEDELIVVDNDSHDGTLDAVDELAPGARVLRNPGNEGFAAACDRGAELATGDLLVFLNPDASPAPGFAEAIRRPLAEGRDWAGWMGLVTMGGGTAINTSGNVAHFTGISWAGNTGRPVSEAAEQPEEVAFLSGACLAVPRENWNRVGGFPEHFFMYCEDLDLSFRLRLAGGRLGIEPGARVDHDYEFIKGPAKWRLLERNRWATIIRTYPTPLLLLVAPALLLTEFGLVVVSLQGGWGRQKLLASLDTLRGLPRLLSERRSIQRQRSIGASEFARWLTPELSSPHLGGVARLSPVQAGLRAYWALVRRTLRVPPASG